ncbi:MAG TPA: GGDEF domain-containing protein [Bryobacteraceae bacterium]|jgi:diguanylate cyclase (GGDEF)-like protein|nr:GGDEF domain-containing protein [Bryobacteraceae bacterium]
MISLRQHMAVYDRELAGVVAGAWRDSIEYFVRSGGKAVPVLAAALQGKLGVFAEELSEIPTLEQSGGIRTRLLDELTRWGEDAEKAAQDNLRQVREMVLAVAASAADIADRDRRYTGRFKQVADRFHSASALTDIWKMRQVMVEGTSEMRVCMRQMAEEGERAIRQLKADVDGYRNQLREYQERSSRDALTGLPNREVIDEHIDHRMVWKTPFSIAILDLNGFKSINDTYGHLAGDALLKKFALELRNLVRATDLVGRWGGDEFVIVVEETYEVASGLVNRAADWAFGRYEIGDGSQQITVPISAAIGLAQWDGTETALELFKRVDDLMYSDKKNPRTGRSVGATLQRTGA